MSEKKPTNRTAEINDSIRDNALRTDVSVPSRVSEQVTRQSNEITNNFVRAAGIYNQLVLSALDAARENTKIYAKTVNAFTDYNTNILNAWTSFWGAQQEEFVMA